MRIHQILKVVSVAVVSLALGACSSGGDTTAAPTPAECAGLDAGTAGSTLLIVTDGQSPALSQLSNLLATEDGAEQLFRSPDLHLDQEPGMVVIAPFSSESPGPVQAFNLGGVGNAGRAVADARTQRACMVQAFAALPPAAGGNLLQSLESSVPLAVNRSTGPVAVLAVGVSRLTILDFSIAGSDQNPPSDLSSPEARATVIETLDHPTFNLVPEMPGRVAGVYFMAPAEGIDPLRADGVRTFVDENLCTALAAPCSSGIEPELAQ